MDTSTPTDGNGVPTSGLDGVAASVKAVLTGVIDQIPGVGILAWDTGWGQTATDQLTTAVVSGSPIQDAQQAITNTTQQVSQDITNAANGVSDAITSIIPSSTTVAEYAIGAAVLLVLLILLLGKVDAL